MVVSRSGFTRNAVDYARDHNVILLTPGGDPEDLLSDTFLGMDAR